MSFPLMLPYAFRQFLWMLHCALQLFMTFRNGAKWAVQMVRVYVYAACVWVYFLPHVWWYLTSANIIRRVAYRSSEATRRRNIMRVLEDKGVDLDQLLGPGRSGGRRKRPPYSRSNQGSQVLLSERGRSAASLGSSTGECPGDRTDGAEPQRQHNGVEGRRPVHRQRPPPRRQLADPSTIKLLLNLNPADGSTLKSLPLRPEGNAERMRSTITCTPSRRAVHPPREPRVRGDSISASPAPLLQPHATATSIDNAPEQQPGKPAQAPSSLLGSVTASPGVAPGKQSSASSCDVTTGCRREDASSIEDLQAVTTGNTVPEDGCHQQVLLAGRESERVALENKKQYSRSPPSANSRGLLPQAEVKGLDELHAESPIHSQPRQRRRYPASLATDDDNNDEEDRVNLHNRATVDIVLPVPLDSLMKALHYASKNTKLQRKKFPIVIIICGGAWIIGSQMWCTMISRIFSARGYVVFCPDYRNFPQTTMEGMTLDVSDAIKWVLDNADRYNGDLSNVTLIGQSAGAQLTMMSLISQAQLCAYRANGNGKDGTPAPSDVAYNVPRYNPRKSIHRYVGLSGMYNLEKLAPHLHSNGLSTRVLHQIAGGKAQIPRYTVPYYFDDQRSGETGETLPDNVFDFLPQRMFFLHGDADKSAPVTESAELVREMRSAQKERTLRRLIRREEERRQAALRQEALQGASAAEGDGASERRAAARRRQLLLTHMVAPTQTDLPLTSVDVEFILIPGARHTDALVEECIVGWRSCCADFLCDYESAAELHSPSGTSCNGSFGPRGNLGAGSEAKASSGGATVRSVPVSAAGTRSPVITALQPDGVLPMAVPPEERPWLLRLFTLICPF